MGSKHPLGTICSDHFVTDEEAEGHMADSSKTAWLAGKSQHPVPISMLSGTSEFSLNNLKN